MPNLGDVAYASAIHGSRSKKRLIWAACEDCGAERWVNLVGGKPQHVRCQGCVRPVRSSGEKRTADIARRRNPCSSCGRPMWWNSGSSRKRGLGTCRECRKGQPAPYGKRGMRDRTLAARRRTCENCGDEFVAASKKGRFCSNKCANSARNAARRLPEAERKAAQRERYAAKCRRRRALKRGAKAEPYTLSEIAERDRYRCGECRKRVAMKRPYPHPSSPSIDHVVPITQGGDDTKANIRLTHLRCNISRGNRGGREQLGLIG